MDSMPQPAQFSLAKVIVNIVLVLLTWVPVLIFKAVVVVPYQRGYFCDDESIRYPFKPSTISVAMLFIMGGSVPIIVLYIEARVVWTLYSPLVRPLIQVVVLCMAVFCALSRVSDYKHHWSDVLTGSIVGTIVGLVIVIGVVRMFKRRELYLLSAEDVNKKSSQLKASPSSQFHAAHAVEAQQQQQPRPLPQQGQHMVYTVNTVI